MIIERLKKTSEFENEKLKQELAELDGIPVITRNERIGRLEREFKLDNYETDEIMEFLELFDNDQIHNIIDSECFEQKTFNIGMGNPQEVIAVSRGEQANEFMDVIEMGLKIMLYLKECNEVWK